MLHSEVLRWSLLALVCLLVLQLREDSATTHFYIELSIPKSSVESINLRTAHEGKGGPPEKVTSDTTAHFGWTDPIYQGNVPLYNDKEEWIEWQETHSEILRNLRLPTTASGDILLPDKLSLPNDLALTLEKGVLFAGTGKIRFCEEEMLPSINHLRHVIGIPDAVERARCRAENPTSVGCDTGFVLVASQEFIDGPLRDVLQFFDVVLTPEDLPNNNYPIAALAMNDDKKEHTNSNSTTDWLLHLRKKQKRMVYTKAVKVHAMAASPFNVTLMLDFDARPCRADFVDELIQHLDGSDIAMTNKYDQMYNVTGDPHYLGQHNSAVMVLNMESVRTRILLSLYIQAFHYNSVKGWNGMDQPSLMVALRAISEPNHKNGPLHGNPLQHVDLTGSVVCRKKISTQNQCSNDPSSCIIVHKPPGWQQALPPASGRIEYNTEKLDSKIKSQPPSNEPNPEKIKIFGIGAKKTGTTTLDSMFKKLFNRKDRVPDELRARAVKDMVYKNNSDLAIELAETYSYFQDAPWCSEPQRLYRNFAARYPTAKFVLTVRYPDRWWSSVERWVQCAESVGSKRKGSEKLQYYAAILGADSTSKEDMIKAFEMHNAGVRNFFYDEIKQPSRLLEIDLTDSKWMNGNGWTAFCSFIGFQHNCPTGNLPEKNKTPESCESLELVK